MTRTRLHVNALIVVTTLLLNVLCKKHIEFVHENKNPNKFSICGYNHFLKCTLGKHIESVHDNMTSCKCSICGHNFILKSIHNYSLNSTLKNILLLNQLVRTRIHVTALIVVTTFL